MRSGAFQLLVACLAAGGLLGLTAARYVAPPVAPADAPGTSFSAERARLELTRVLGDGAPRPVGSAAADAARQRIVERLRELGYSPSIQEAFACGEIRSCARVRNVVALRPGREPDGKLVLFSTHYDSVSAGPGASDDAMAVAAQLEIARALAESPPARNGIVFLVNEGEEVGLLGAEAFVAEHPLAARVGVVVNVEARGTTGPSFMFELSEPNGWLVRTYAEHVRRPATNSVAYAVYKLLPNDTDLTVYKRAGLAGLNFAIIGGETRYHTPRDDAAHADPRSLQHHGDNALAMVRALTEVNLEARPDGEDVFFDLFSLRTLRWPLSWMRPGAAAAAVLALIAAWVAVGRGRVRGPELGWGLVAWMFAVAGSAGAVAGTHAALKELGAFPYPWIASPGPARIALWGAGAFGALLLATAFGGLARARGLWLGATVGWALAGTVAAVLAPDMSYLAVLPALASAFLGVLWALGPGLRSASAQPVGSWAWLPPFATGAAAWM
ncbi:MAG TPA: M20/M25/M40 family metallo-hydrolase, partial [Myxococcaceae bacterium]|nr:M20/M25/M40 family metallo-hydrolase [Myxococcaceae bacterium]